MEQTLFEYLQNPMGKGSAAITSRQLIIQDYNSRFTKLNTIHDFTPIIYKDSRGQYFFHIQVPSETDRQNTYDVIIQFIPPDPKDVNGKGTIKDYYVKFFSNSPAFVYTYAYVYNEHDMLVKELKSKYDKTVLAKRPVERNPQETFNYEKSLYFAAHYLELDAKYLNKLIIDPIAKSYTLKKLENSVRNDDKIKYQIAREKRRIDNIAKDNAKAIKRETRIEEKRIKNAFKRTGNMMQGKVKPVRSTFGSSNTPKGKIKPKGKIRAKRKS